jgi:hypothetical protein
MIPENTFFWVDISGCPGAAGRNKKLSPNRGDRGELQAVTSSSKQVRRAVREGPAEGMERVKGIEPSYAAWEAAVLPLNYTRIAKELSVSGGELPSVRTAWN